MKSLKRRFKNISDRNPEWSSYICFAEAIKGQHFSKNTIRRWFSCLVENDDYNKSEKRVVMSHLSDL